MTDRNKNRPGYKKTKVGWIPEEWITVLLSDVCAVRFSGVDKKYSRSERAVSLCNYTDVYYNDRIVSGMSFMTATASQREMEQFELKAGDVLLTKDSETADDIAKCAYVPQDLPGVLCGYHLALLRPDQALVSGKFLSHKLNAYETRQRFTRFANGVIRFGLNLEIFSEFTLALPPLPEQKKIAEILSTWNEALEQTRQLISAAKRRKKALMQKLLTGKKRLPGFNGKWKTTRLCDLGRITSGGTPDSGNAALWNGKIPWITPSEVTHLKSPYVTTTKRMISHSGLQQSSAELIPAQSLIVCTRATIGDCCINTVPMTTNQGFKCLVPNQNRANILYLYYWITLNRHELLRVAGGSTFAEVPKQSFERLEVSLPELDEQRAIAAVLQTADEEITVLESKLAALEKQKKGLMQKLLTGEVRLIFGAETIQ